MTDHLAALQEKLNQQNQEIGRLTVIREVLQWALTWKDRIPQPVLDELITLTERLRHAPPS